MRKRGTRLQDPKGSTAPTHVTLDRNLSYCVSPNPVHGHRPTPLPTVRTGVGSVRVSSKCKCNPLSSPLLRLTFGPSFTRSRHGDHSPGCPFRTGPTGSLDRCPTPREDDTPGHRPSDFVVHVRTCSVNVGPFDSMYLPSVRGLQ